MAINIIDKNLQFKSNHTNRVGAPKGIVLHHAAAPYASVETIHAWHINNGWAGIGYHFYVRKDGSIYRGRPENWIGGHTYGYNDTLGICAEGNFQNEKMSQAQKDAIVGVIQYLLGKYGDLTVKKHEDYAATACPGMYYPFDEIVKAAKGGTTTATTTTEEKKHAISVQDFQTEAIADGLPLNVYGADGIWGDETEKAASKVLKKGSVGNRVLLIQQYLQHDLKKYGVDGHFGDETEQAVKNFQKKKGITVDGIVGVETWKKLLGVS